MTQAQRNIHSTTTAQVISQPANIPTLIPVTQWAEHHAWPSVNGLRALVFNSATNGFNSAFLKVGGRVLVNEAEFFAAVAKCAERRPLQRGKRRGHPVQSVAGAMG